MKIKKGFVLRDVAGRSVVVATGAAAKKFRGMIMLNDTGKEIWIRFSYTFVIFYHYWFLASCRRYC
mgnify:CR=1 FL=1